MRFIFFLLFPVCLIAQDKPVLFMPGIVSDGMNNRDFTISPDGNTIYYSVQQRNFLLSAILRIEKKNGKWGKPEVAPFSGGDRDLEASFSPDGNRIWFVSDRPASVVDTTNDFDIWYVDKTATGWSEPINAGPVVNGPGNEFYPSVAKNGNLYFTVALKNGKGKEDIVMCAFNNGTYSAPVSLPEAINSGNDEYNAFIDPEEQFILFGSDSRAGGIGRGDIYISLKDASGNWKPAKLLDGVNTTYTDYCPYVTRDKQYFYFSSNRPIISKGRHDYKQISKILMSAGNGFDDIYMVKFAY